MFRHNQRLMFVLVVIALALASCRTAAPDPDATPSPRLLALWTHELNGEMWASALVADGKVFVGTRRGEFRVFAANREKQLLSTVELGQPISATATAANRTLYVATMTHLYALAESGAK